MTTEGSTGHGDPHPAPNEIRIAVAMNGGVSLAVWIAGVAYELARASNSQMIGSSWSRLLGSRSVVVDVLAGTSAGGINAAFLALNQAHGAELEALRRMWLDLGGLEPPEGAASDEPHLLRAPAKGAQSILDGKHFVDRLERAFASLLDTVKGDRSVPDAARLGVDLRLTTTSFEGRQEEVGDSFAGTLHERAHRASFHFVYERRGGEALRCASRRRSEATWPAGSPAPRARRRPFPSP